MTTGEKLALLRKKKGITQEELSDLLDVSRQSVSRWEMDIAFPETEKLIKLSKLFDCSIDFLLNTEKQENKEDPISLSVHDCYSFIRECGYFFLATSVENQPRLRPMGMIYANEHALFFSTDKRKDVCKDLTQNSQVELASYNMSTRRWIRISGRVEVENSISIKNDMMMIYPMLKQGYRNENEIFHVIYRLLIENISIS